MRWNWNPERVLFLDFETASEVDLKKDGTYAYLTDPSTRVLSLVVKVPGGVPVIWIPPDRCPGSITAGTYNDLFPEEWGTGDVRIERGADFPARLIAEYGDRTWVAHNAEGFDSLAWRYLVGGDEPAWYDTLPCVRAAGWPGALDTLGRYLFGKGKHKEGHRAMQLLTSIRKGKPNIGTVPLWANLIRYNVGDVLALEQVFRLTLDHGEPDVLDAHAAVNGRGIKVDVPHLNRLGELWHELERESLARVPQLTKGDLTGDDLRSGVKVHRWLESKGLKLDTLNRKELERFYDDPADYFADADSEHVPLVVEVLKLRQIAVRAGRGKIDRIKAMVEQDGRVRRMLRYWGAHTGRWSGSGVQPQNFARGVDIDVEGLISGDLTLDRVREAAGKHGIDDALSTLLRPVFVAEPGRRLLICDYNAIEGRGIAWVANQTDLLKLFAEHKDPYLDMASTVFGRPCTKGDKTERQVGKVIVLGCGYGMSARKFGGFCEVSRVDLLAAGTTAQMCVTAYRQKNAAIVAIWRAYDRAAKAAIQTCKPVEVGRCRFDYDGADLSIKLPSGRPILYRRAEIADRVPGYCALLGLPPEPKPTIVYHNPKGYEGHLYGGLIAENIVQAICRDLLASALVQCERAGLTVVLHVHDELVVEGRADQLERLAEIMVRPPAWAPGFPIGVEGFDCARYVKAPWSDSRKVKL